MALSDEYTDGSEFSAWLAGQINGGFVTLDELLDAAAEMAEDFDVGLADAPALTRTASLFTCLERHGLVCAWDGTIGRRIGVAFPDWRRRLPVVPSA